MRPCLAIGWLALVVAGCGSREADQQLASAIDAIRAIDNHAHVVAPDVEHDSGYDALPCDILPPATSRPPANTRFGPDLQAAWKALYGFDGNSDAPETLRQLQAH